MAVDASQRPLDPVASDLDASHGARLRRRRGIWVAVTSLLVSAGIAGSVLGASGLANSDHQKARSAFASSASEVAAKLVLVIEHEEDLVVGARAFLADNPNASQAAFLRWTNVVGALERSPELEGGGEVVIVPASRLAAFAARQTAEPAIPLPAGGYHVLPPGRRPYYCLLSLTLARKPAVGIVPAGLDYCYAKTELRAALFAARDSGENAYLPNRTGSRTELLIETPIYRGGIVPKTVSERRRTLVGAFATSVNPRIILATALQGHPGIVVEFRYGGSQSPVVFRSAAHMRRGESATFDLGSGWTMQASGQAIASGVLADGKALSLLSGGIALSVLFGLLMFVLGTGRARAQAMVSEKTRELSHLALHDALTGLPNRALVLDRAERMLARARREPSIVVAALYIDVDSFKRVNDNFGHAAGDRLLRIVGERLREVIRDQDTVGRLGGDEFIVLLESATREAPPDVVAERLIEAMRRPIVLDDGATTFSSSVSVGIAIGPRATADELLRDADLALYTAKQAGKDCAVLFQAAMQSAAREHLQLESDLDEALEHGQFFLLYQPIVDLDSARMVGVEALIRWRHPRRGIVAPEDFVPLAEETGQIAAIGRWVLEEACRQAAAWAAEGHPMEMSVNVSAYQLDHDGFLADVRRVLETSKIEPSSLTLEITETALMRDVAAASKRLKKIKALGVRVAIDDFGTGSSSLAYLRQFAADSLKIDRSFIADMTDSREAAAIIRTLVDLGKMLGIETLAEGVEEQGQLTQLQLDQCDRGQGFLFAQPLDAGGIARLLAGSTVHTTA